MVEFRIEFNLNKLGFVSDWHYKGVYGFSNEDHIFDVFDLENTIDLNSLINIIQGDLLTSIKTWEKLKD